MPKHSYKDYVHEELTLRDKLASERTALANERTLLSYVRTTIGLVAVGGTLIKLFTGIFSFIAGLTLIAIGCVVLVVGFSRYLRVYFLIHEIEQTDGAANIRDDKAQYFLMHALEKLHLKAK